MSWAWHRAWAEAAAPAEVQASEALVLRDGDGALRAVLPVRLGRVRFRGAPLRTLTWAIGDAGCPDHLDVLALPDADLGALVPALEAIPWQVAILDNLAERAPNADRLCRALQTRGFAVRRSAQWICPRLKLPATWEAYLGALSPTRRQTLRRKERNLHRDHAVTLTDYSEDRLAEGWDHLMRLHEQRWQGAGAFHDRRVEGLQLGFAREMARRGQLWLSTLDVDGEPAAAWYGFSCHDTVYFYQSGRAARWEAESVGLVLMGLMIRRAIAQGFRWFDLLRGEDPYKRQWAETQRITTEVVIFRPGWQGHWVRALDWVGRRRDALRRGGGIEP